MSTLKFTLSAEATGRVHDFLLCLAKFGEQVCLEARNDQLTFTTLNSSRTAYASFGLDPKAFFISYTFGSFNTAAGSRFTCQIYTKALLSVFKSRFSDPRAGGGSIERCEVNVEDQPDKVRCRIVVRMICGHGVTKTYRLTYESTEISHALFDKTTAPNGWTISSRILREYIEYFGTKTENLDLLAKDGKAIFTSFTEKVMDGKETLKQPLETAIAIHKEDFQDFHAEEDMHVVISVRDFKAIVTHADTLRVALSAHFSRPSRPLQFSYKSPGMTCEFTLMTSGDYRSSSSAAPRAVSTRPESRQASTSTRSESRQASITTAQPISVKPSDMGPPPKPASVGISSLRERRALRPMNREPSQATTTSERDTESLFMPRGDEEERAWGPTDFDEDQQPEEMLGWDVNADIHGISYPGFRDTGSHARPTSTQNGDPGSQGLPPTQRLSQMRGLFD